MYTDKHRYLKVLSKICVYPPLSVVNLFLYLSCLFSIVACSTASQSFHNAAIAQGLSFEHVQGANFRHIIYANKATSLQRDKTLHVYIGSDGTPWFEHRYITKDPTPLRPVLIGFVKRDQRSAIYLGRPCYHQLGDGQENCTEELWTSDRYSRRVVESMVAALQKYIVKHQYKKVQLIGFSGGGSLAMLIAPKIQQVRSVVTLAGNLDTDAWTRHHQYLPLSGSLNPSKQHPLHSGIRQIHFIGERDKNITPSMLTDALKNQLHPKLVVLSNLDHSCCWLTHFNEITQSLVKQNIEEGH